MSEVHPKHYKSHPAGIECIDVIEDMNFNLGTCTKYIWRVSFPGATRLPSKDIIDLEKAKWYLEREIANLRKERGDAPAS